MKMRIATETRERKKPDEKAAQNPRSRLWNCGWAISEEDEGGGLK